MLYLSSVAGLPSARFGSRVLIGAERDLIDPTEIRYTPEVIVAIPTSEVAKYAREYRRAIADGSVRERTEAEWRAQQTPSPAPTEAGAPLQPTADPPPEDEAAHHGDSESSS